MANPWEMDWGGGQQQQPRSNSGDAISAVESGGRYHAVGPVTRDGDRAFGKYQIMGKNIGPWSEEALGRRLSVGEFMSNPEAQEAVFSHRFGQYEKKYGPSGAARAWFAGEGGMNDYGRRDVLGTSVADYERKFNAQVARAGRHQPDAPDNAMAFAPQQQAQPQMPWQMNWGQQDNRIEVRPSSVVAKRDAEFDIPSEEGALRAGLNTRGQQLTQGQPQGALAKMATEAMNVLPAATQGTNPNVDQYAGKLISTEVFESDSGEILYRDPVSGKVVSTDNSKQVAIRDPADGRVKIFERSEATDEGGAVGAARVLAPGLGAGAVTARPAIAVAGKIQPTGKDILATRAPHYAQFDKIAADNFVVSHSTISRIKRAIAAAKQPQHLADEVYKTVDMIDEGTDMVALTKLRDIKEILGQSAKSNDARIRAAAGAASKEINKIIGEVSPEAASALTKADAIHGAGKSVQEIEQLAKIAGVNTNSAGYGGNAVNHMRQVLKPIVKNAIKGKHTGFTPDEIAFMHEIVEGDKLTNAARQIGALAPSKGVMQIGLGTVTGGLSLAVGAIGNKVATMLTARQLNRLQELISKRSPEYEKAVSAATERYYKAQHEFANKPSPAKFAAYLTSSRALSAGLQRDGIEITTGDLLRAIQGPAQGKAEDEQE